MITPDVTFLQKNFYEPLYQKLSENKELKENSIILSLLIRTSNTRYDYLKKFSYQASRSEKDMIDILISKQYIRITDEHNKYQITAYGVWEIEKDVVRFEKLLEIFDTKYFNVFTQNKPLNDKEKIALFAMISVRTFSEKCPLNRENGETVLEYWKEIIDESYNFLKSKKIVQEVDLYKKDHIEHPVVYLFRRLNELTKKTRNLFKTYSNVAYLDLYNNETQSFDEDGLSYLFWKVFENELDLTNQKDIFNYCDKIVKEYKAVIFNDSEFDSHVFSKIDYDEKIRDCLFKANINKHTYKLAEN